MMDSDAMRLWFGLLLGFTLAMTVVVPATAFIYVALPCSLRAKALLALLCVGASAVAAALMSFVAFPRQ